MKTPLHDLFVREALMTEHRGWEIPASFQDVGEEVHAALTGVAVMDSTPRARLRLSGPDGIDLLHRLSTNDLLGLRPGATAATVLTNEKGRIVDALLVLKRSQDHLLVASTGAEEEILRWVEKFTIMESLELEPVTGRTFMATLLGPGAPAILASIRGISRDDPEARYASLDVVEEGGLLPRVHLVAPQEEAAPLWTAVRAAGAVPVGLHAWELLRIMHGIPERPGELSSEFNPYDAGLRSAISFTKGCYIGQEVIARLDTYQKVRWGLFGLISRSDEFVPGSVLADAEGKELGSVTSRAPVPVEGWWLSLAVMRLEASRGVFPVKRPGGKEEALVASFPLHIPPTLSAENP